jgi:large subunit ribosomal protein L3
MAACTVVEAGPCFVLGIRSDETNGYNAVRLCFGEVKKESLSKPVAGEFAKVFQEDRETYPAQYVSEFRVKDSTSFEVGAELKVDTIFEEGSKVDVTGISKGKGFTGVVKRWNFAGGPKTHGSKFHRHPGSIGQHSDPGRIWKGKKMAGHHGVSRKTVSNLEVTRILPDKNLVVVKGHVPGPTGGMVLIRKAKRG